MVKRCCAQSCFNSQTTNRQITYFGFPRYWEFAKKWAKAANREDLLEKSLDCITKYFLCAEHFASESFIDPPYNTRLKKINHPLSIPIPSIFKCNFAKHFVPNQSEKKGTNKNKERRYTPYTSSKVSTPAGVSLLNRLAKNSSIEIKNLKNTNDDLDNVNSYANFNNYDQVDNYDVNLIIEESHEDESIDHLGPNIELDPLNSPIDIVHLTCRLCASCFCTPNELYNIFNDALLEERINRLMPGVIAQYDGLPQSVCHNCSEKVNACIETLDSFNIAQRQIKAAFSEEECGP